MPEEKTEYVPQGTATMDQSIDGFDAELKQVRLWVAQETDGSISLQCGYKPESGESRLFVVESTKDEVADLVQDWLGASAAEGVISRLGISAEEAAQDRNVKDINGVRYVHLYAPRARNAFLGTYAEEVLGAPEGDVTHLFPKEGGNGFFQRRSPEEWAARNAVQTLQGLVDEGIITSEQMVSKLAKDGHLANLI